MGFNLIEFYTTYPSSNHLIFFITFKDMQSSFDQTNPNFISKN